LGSFSSRVPPASLGCSHRGVVQGGEKWVGTCRTPHGSQALHPGCRASPVPPGKSERLGSGRMRSAPKKTISGVTSHSRKMLFWGKKPQEWVQQIFNLPPSKKYRETSWLAGQFSWEIRFFLTRDDN